MMREGSDSSFWKMSMGKRPEYELYNVAEDPYCMRNLAAEPDYGTLVSDLKSELVISLKSQGDPRMGDDGDIFDRYPFDDPAKANIYEDVVSGRIPLLGWQGNQRIITRLPASSRTHPAMVFQVRDSPRKMTANMIVSTRLHLSMGTTLLTSPILMA